MLAKQVSKAFLTSQTDYSKELVRIVKFMLHPNVYSCWRVAYAVKICIGYYITLLLPGSSTQVVTKDKHICSHCNLPSLWIISGIPPALTATTGTWHAIASSTTNPNVSLSDGIAKRSALAYDADSSSPYLHIKPEGEIKINPSRLSKDQITKKMKSKSWNSHAASPKMWSLFPWSVAASLALKVHRQQKPGEDWGFSQECSVFTAQISKSLVSDCYNPKSCPSYKKSGCNGNHLQKFQIFFCS